MNSRCGIPQGSDFDTPEYTTFSSVSQRKWESNMGMDPYSYGYNRATAPRAYMNASTIVTSLVDMVSKNGNLLLDFGPKADGTIEPVEVAHLMEAGTWIRANGEAIFNTTYWYVSHLVTLQRTHTFCSSTDTLIQVHDLRVWQSTIHADARCILYPIVGAAELNVVCRCAAAYPSRRSNLDDWCRQRSSLGLVGGCKWERCYYGAARAC